MHSIGPRGSIFFAEIGCRDTFCVLVLGDNDKGGFRKLYFILLVNRLILLVLFKLFK